MSVNFENIKWSKERYIFELMELDDEAVKFLRDCLEHYIVKFNEKLNDYKVIFIIITSNKLNENEEQIRWFFNLAKSLTAVNKVKDDIFLDRVEKAMDKNPFPAPYTVVKQGEENVSSDKETT